MVNDPLVMLNVMLCIAIVIRMAFFRRRGERHRVVISWLVVAVNLIIRMAVFRAKGNAVKLFHRRRNERER